MSHSERCPVCHGEGKVPDGPHGNRYQPCHGCNGRGWITVGDSRDFINPADHPRKPFRFAEGKQGVRSWAR